MSQHKDHFQCKEIDGNTLHQGNDFTRVNTLNNAQSERGVSQSSRESVSSVNHGVISPLIGHSLLLGEAGSPVTPCVGTGVCGR